MINSSGLERARPEKRFANSPACSSVNPVSANREFVSPPCRACFGFLPQSRLSAIVYGSMIALTIFVQPQPREITVTIPPDRFFAAALM